MKKQEAHELIQTIKRLAVVTYQNIDAILKPYGLARSQYIAMYHIRGHESINNHELADLMQLRPATLTGIIQTLEQKDFVERVVTKDDRRVTEIRLTSNGEELMSKIPSPREMTVATLTSGVSSRDIDKFITVADSMVENINKYGVASKDVG